MSKVRLNVTDDGGDNFKAKAMLQISAEAEPCEQGAAESGIMTVWKLIQLEAVKMPSGNELPYGSLNAHFEKAFVEWRIEPPRTVPDQNPMGPDGNTARIAVRAYVTAPPNGQFEHEGQGGWFFMASAGDYVPDSGAQSEVLIDFETDGNSTVDQGEGTGLPGQEPTWVAGILELPATIPSGKVVTSVSIFNPNGSESVTFGAELYEGDSGKIRVFAPNYHPQEDNPNSDDYMGLPDHGFAVGSTIHAKVYSPGALYTSGISPALEVNGYFYFQGRTVVDLLSCEPAALFLLPRAGVENNTNLHGDDLFIFEQRQRLAFGPPAIETRLDGDVHARIAR